jgi:ABC-type Fe3+ transport system permease subunit
VVLTGTAAIIVLSIFIRRLPYTVRTTSSALRQMIAQHGGGGRSRSATARSARS